MKTPRLCRGAGVIVCRGGAILFVKDLRWRRMRLVLLQTVRANVPLYRCAGCTSRAVSNSLFMSVDYRCGVFRRAYLPHVL